MDHKMKGKASMNKVDKQKKEKNSVRQQYLTSDGLKKAMEQVNNYLNDQQLEEAIALSDILIELHPNNEEVVDQRATCAIEVNDCDKAIELLTHCVALNPDTTKFSRYCSRAQLRFGEDAVNDYKKAAEIITKSLSKDAGDNSKNESMGNGSDAMDAEESPSNDGNKDSTAIKTAALKRSLSETYSNIVQIYTTDLCDEPDAEDLVKFYLDLSLKADPTCPDAHIVKAKYLNIVGMPDEAEKELMDCRPLWFPQPSDFAKPTDVSTSMKMYLAKILIELSMNSDAEAILDSLVMEEVYVVEVHYLLGWNKYLQGEAHYKQAAQHFNVAKEVHEACPSDDQMLLDHINQLLEEIESDGYETVDDDSDEDDEETVESKILQNSEDMSDDEH